MITRISPEGVAFIRRWEGARRNAYQDVAGKWTIGVGHLLTPQEKTSGRIWTPSGAFIWRDGLTDEQIDAILAMDLQSVENTLGLVLLADVNQAQFDAIASLTYNIGGGAISRSTLLRKANAGDLKGAAEHFLDWRLAGGKEVAGLVRRREAERRLWLDGVYT
jgi:lysozyme